MTAVVTITGLGGYSGVITRNFTIVETTSNKKEIADCQISVIPEIYICDGFPKTPHVTVEDKGNLLKEGVDYMIEYQDNVNSGTAKVIITGTGQYTGTVVKTFLIEKNENDEKDEDEEDKNEKKDLSVCQITISRNPCFYDGKKQEPDIIVEDDGRLLSAGTDYTVEYLNNINAGTANITVTGTGDYVGTVTETFIIHKASQKVSYTHSYRKSYGNKPFSLNVKLKEGNGKLLYASSNKKVADIYITYRYDLIKK